MMGLLRWRRLPARQRPPLDRDERVLAWAGLPDGEVVVATTRGLWLPGADAGTMADAGAEAGRWRLGWHEIHKATWAGRQLTLVAARGDDHDTTGPHRETAGGIRYHVMVDRPAVTYTLLDPDRVPEQVRARVNRSVAHTALHEVPGGGSVRVVARRVSGVDGLHWTVRYENGADPQVAEAVEATGHLIDLEAAAFTAGLRAAAL